MNQRERKQIKRKLKEAAQYSRYTAEELSLISNTFFENDDLLMALRKFFLQGELSQQELVYLNNLTDDVRQLIHKTLLPEIDPNAPLYQVVDLWVSIDTVGKLPEDSCLDMKARKIVIDYLEDQFRRMPDNKPNIYLQDLIYQESKDSERAFVELKARNTIIQHIDRHLDELRLLAINNAKIPEDEKQKRVMMDSNR